MDKIKKIFVAVIIILLFVCCIGLIIQNRNLLNNSNTPLASDISKQYDNIDYGDFSSLSRTTITNGGSYSLDGSYECITVNTNEDVLLNLTNVTIICDSGPAINIEKAKTVSIVLNGKNVIKATTTVELDGAIYSKADLILSGSGNVDISSNYDGIVSKDTLVIKSGGYTIDVGDDGIRVGDNVAIVDGAFNINALGDGIKATNEEDSTMGYIVIDGGAFNITSVTDAIQVTTELVINNGAFNIKTSGNEKIVSAKGLKAVNAINITGGTFSIDVTDDGIHTDGDIKISDGVISISSTDDAIHADGMILITGGTFEITAAEGIEATYVKITDGVISISASDDGINAGNKSNKYKVTVEITGGTITIKMGQGDTDGIDANGNLYISGGIIDITANSPFDYDGEAKYTGGTIIVNGEETNTITNQTFGGPGGMGPNGRGGRY